MTDITKIYLVSKPSKSGDVLLQGFESQLDAERYCINYLYDKSTREDRNNSNGVQRTEYSGGYIDFYIYTNEFGNLTLTVKELPFKREPFWNCY